MVQFYPKFFLCYRRWAPKARGPGCGAPPAPPIWPILNVGQCCNEVALQNISIAIKKDQVGKVIMEFNIG